MFVGKAERESASAMLYIYPTGIFLIKMAITMAGRVEMLEFFYAVIAVMVILLYGRDITKKKGKKQKFESRLPRPRLQTQPVGKFEKGQTADRCNSCTSVVATRKRNEASSPLRSRDLFRVSRSSNRDWNGEIRESGQRCSSGT